MAKEELILLDSNIIIDVINGDKRIKEQIKNLSPENVFISVITEMEVLIGAKNKTMLMKLKKALKSYNIINIDEKSSVTASRLINKYRLSHGLDIPDSFIAAIALTHNLYLLTNNVKDFKFIQNLKLYNLEK